MRVIRERAEARWLPSRFHFALARLLAWFVFRRTPPRRQPGLVLALDRYQSAVENYAVAAGSLIASACYAGVVLARVADPLVAAILAIPAAAVALQFCMHVSAAVLTILRIRQPMRINSAVVMATLFAASAYAAVSQLWVRHVGRAFLVIVGSNVVAAAVVWSLRRRIDALEEQYEVRV